MVRDEPAFEVAGQECQESLHGPADGPGRKHPSAFGFIVFAYEPVDDIAAARAEAAKG
jgi:hypothetical protein